jgi:peroxiredoxin
MKARPLLALAALLVVAPLPACAKEAPSTPAVLALGASIPMADAKLKNVDGKEVTIAGAKGAKGTLVVFTCNACPWAKKWEGRVASIGNDAVKRGIGVIAINSNDPAKNPEDGYDVMQARAKKHDMKFAYAVDGTSEVATAFGASRTPEIFLFDAAGKLVYHGTVDDNADDAGKVTKPYLKDAVVETKAMGCGIKFRSKSAS